MAENPDPSIVFSHAEPVLAVHDVAETIKYWQDVLGFTSQWTWGDPPTLGSVSWHTAYIQFFKDAEKAKQTAGSYVWIRMNHVDRLYEHHKKLGAEIVDPLRLHEYGLSQYVVKDLNGHFIVFAGSEGKHDHSQDLPLRIKIVERIPGIDEFNYLRRSTSGPPPDELHPDHLKGPIYGVVAIDTDTNQTIGCALLWSDNASFYYLKDVMVAKEWQGQHVGTALMTKLVDWLDKNGIPKSLVGLYTGEQLESFYKRFGFMKAFGMIRHL